jgi:PAS domain S-box-containing protein
MSDLHDASPAPIDRATLELLEILPVQVWTSRPDGLLDYVSARAAADFGVSATQLVDEGWLGVLHPDDVAATVARWTHSLAMGEPYAMEFRLRRSHGAFEWYLARAEAQRDAEGRITRWVGSNMNIHEQKELQSRTEGLLDQVGAQARETQAALVELQSARRIAEQRVKELEAALAER